ncbi:class I SAM-dependent methyltransferase [Bacillus sp. JJ1503]|uniref:class I SAM-dependent methyltransferase n=1 Tax=unclassified Bacillus (in: firmicutes) TaxID=185979 RepID=UPI002FFEE2E4
MSKFGVGGAHPGGIQLTKEIFMLEELNNTSHILDVGCGTGQTAAYLASKYGVKVTGMDINPIMVKKAKIRMKKHQLPVEIIQGSIEECPLKSNHFDFIISESVLAFVNKPRSLKEIFRLLKKEGRFIANELTINHPLKKSEIEEIKQFYGLDHVLTENEWITLMEQTGFKNIKISRNQHSILQDNPDVEFQYSVYIEPELYSVFLQHFNLMAKYQGALDYRIFSCTK